MSFGCPLVDEPSCTFECTAEIRETLIDLEAHFDAGCTLQFNPSAVMYRVRQRYDSFMKAEHAGARPDYRREARREFLGHDRYPAQQERHFYEIFYQKSQAVRTKRQRLLCS